MGLSKYTYFETFALCFKVFAFVLCVKVVSPSENGRSFSAYSVEKIEVLAGKLGNDENATTPSTSTSITGDILLRGVRKVNQKTGGDGEFALDDFSKVLDENGEPLVMYHGTELYHLPKTEGRLGSA